MTTDAAVARYSPRRGAGWRDPSGMYAPLRNHDPVHDLASEAGDHRVAGRLAPGHFPPRSLHLPFIPDGPATA